MINTAVSTAQVHTNRIVYAAGEATAVHHRGTLRVVMVTPRYLPHMGGVEHHVHEVARRMAQLGISITVLTTEPGEQKSVVDCSDGVTIVRVPAWPKGKDYYFAPGIYRTIRRGAWDIIHIQSYHTLVAPLAMLAAFRSRTPYVVTFHGGGHTSKLRNSLRHAQWILLRPLLARADKLIAIARFEEAYYGKPLHLPPERFVLIPNGSDLPAASMAASTSTDAGTLIASVGRLERYKGHHKVITAMPYILKERPDARLWIAGTGPYEPALRDLARRLGVSERVEIRSIPPNQRDRMADELSRVALVVLLSEFETNPIAILEALALGRPALVADTSGMSELAAQGYARAIPLHSTARQIADAIVKELGQSRQPVHLTLPSWDDTASQLLALYQDIKRSHPCAS